MLKSRRYFVGSGGGGGGRLSIETHAERSKNRNSSALSWALSGGPEHAPGMAPIGLPPAWRSLNTALPQYCAVASPASAVLIGIPPTGVRNERYLVLFDCPSCGSRAGL